MKPTVDPNGIGRSESKRNARILVLVITVILFVACATSLRSVPTWLCAAGLISVNFLWDSRRIPPKTKLVTCLLGIGLVLVSQGVEMAIESSISRSEQAKQRAINAERDRSEQKKVQEDNSRFNAMSGEEHLTTAKALLHVNASAADVSAGFKHLDHVDSVKHSAAVKVKTEYLEAQKKADEIAASRAAAAARREAAEQNALSELSRIAAAKTMENQMLDEGMNVDVKAIGPKHTVLHIKYIFVNKVFAHKLSENSEMFNSLRKAGFKKLVATDGYDEQWTWQL